MTTASISNSALVEGSTRVDLSHPNEESPTVGDVKGSALCDAETGLRIVEFFKGKKLLITGATGFLAKIIIEKMLRAIPDVDKIYVVIKAGSKEVGARRLTNEIISAGIFEILRQTYGKSYQAFMLSKLIPVAGNICEPSFGLDKDTANMIAKDVDVIINSAANTKFHERYDVALYTNTRGASHIMAFAKKCKKLRLFLHISTAYVNGQRRGHVMEKPFCMGDSIAMESFIFGTTPKSTVENALDVEGEIESLSSVQQAFGNNLVTLAQKMRELGLERAKKYGWQDTYSFTKAMGEMMIGHTREQVPVVIIRPSIIESTCKEPFPGWIEGNRSADPIIMMYGKGEISGFLTDPNGVVDWIPADMVVNATLAAIAKHGAAGMPSEMNVYHVASSVANPLVIQDVFRIFYEHFVSFPCLDAKGNPILIPKFKYFFTMEDFSSHLWSDTVQSRMLAKEIASSPDEKSHLKALQKKSVELAIYVATIYEPYGFYAARFDISNTQRLMECMSGEEREKFGFEIGSINWEDYIKNVHIPGLRRNVWKENPVASRI